MFAPSILEQTNTLLALVTVGSKPPVICFLTGSSGCGKTYLVEALEEKLNPEKVGVCYFDRVGVPSPKEMIAEFGSGEKWQEVTTHKWVKRIAAMRDKALVIFEGQYNPTFAINAILTLGITDYKIALVTADQNVWEERLRGPRGQEFLVTDDMRNWAGFLRDQTVKTGGSIIDTSDSNIEKNLEQVAALINPMLTARIKW